MENVTKYYTHLREMVALELEEERRAYQRSIEEKSGLADGSICEPACRYPVQLGDEAYNALGQLTVEVRYEVLESEVELDFEPGRPVTFFHIDADAARELPHQC